MTQATKKSSTETEATEDKAAPLVGERDKCFTALIEEVEEPYTVDEGTKALLRQINQGERLMKESLAVLSQNAGTTSNFGQAYLRLMDTVSQAGSAIRNVSGHQAVKLGKERKALEGGAA